MRISKALRESEGFRRLQELVKGKADSICLALATPTYEMKVLSPCKISSDATLRLLWELGIECEPIDLPGDAYVHRAKNTLLTDIHKSGRFTNILYADSDMSWPAEAVVRMLMCDKELVAGAYPTKNHWESWGVNIQTMDGIPIGDPSIPLIRANWCSGGFLMMNMAAIDRMVKAYPDLTFWGHNPKHEEVEYYWFFDTGIPYISEDKKRRFRGEDVTFMHRFSAAGGEMWIYPDITIGHYGMNRWEGNYHDYLMSRPRADLGKVNSVEPESAIISKAKRGAEDQSGFTFTDIIIPTYENEELTEACLRSIYAHTEGGTYRIIWVDNGSKNTERVAKHLDGGMNHIKILLKENKGFVGAINEGLKVSDAPTVCFLNNDTIVPPRWLEKLNSILYSDDKIGIVGPLTESLSVPMVDSGQNLFSQMQTIDLPPFVDPLYRSVFESFNKDINIELEKMYSGKYSKPPGFVAFLCSVMKREVLEKVTASSPRYKNGLDENYKMGLWDDNDYNNAILKAGYKAVLALDTCIYHKGRSTFAIIQDQEGVDVKTLHDQNKQYLDKMWSGNGCKKTKPAVMLALYPYQGQGLDAWLDHGAGMTYTAARQAGCDIDFIDMKALASDDDLHSAMKGYEVVAFGLKSSYYATGMKIIEIAKAQGSKVLVGGYHVTAAVHELLENPDIDWVLHGESEITFPKFLKDPSQYPREIFGEKPPVLDDLPFMDRSMYRSPLEPCEGWWHGNNRKRMVSVMTARGCRHGCLFCQPLERNHFGAKIRRRSVDSVISELLELKGKYNPDCVMIHDDTFLDTPGWIEEFIQQYPKVGLPFWAAGRADGICNHPDLVRKLIGVGWELVSVGFESGSQRILDLMKKGTTVAQNFEAAKIIKKFGAKIYANYMIGLPWEDRHDMEATFNMAKQINAEMPSWAYFAPYPGCELGERCIKEGLSLLDRNSYDRCPSGIKCKNVDYDYVYQKLSEFQHA